MDNPGQFEIGTKAVTTAGTSTTDWVDGLEGLLALLVQIGFVYGSGGTNCKVYLQTCVDDDETPIDIACVVFTTASAKKVLNFSALTPKTTAVAPGDGALADDSAIDGILGHKFRLKIVSTGTYAGSTQVSVFAIAR